MLPVVSKPEPPALPIGVLGVTGPFTPVWSTGPTGVSGVLIGCSGALPSGDSSGSLCMATFSACLGAGGGGVLASISSAKSNGSGSTGTITGTMFSSLCLKANDIIIKPAKAPMVNKALSKFLAYSLRSA